MCTCWQNTVYVLSVVILKCRMGAGKPKSVSNISYLPDFSTIFFAAWSFSFFLSNRHQRLHAVLISPPSDIPGRPCQLDFTVLKNLTFYLNLINSNIMKVCGGCGDLHPPNFNCFTSVTCVVNLAPLPLYPRKRTHITH